MAKVKADITGQKFGEWEVLGYAGGGKWHCRCSCGFEKDILKGKLTCGQTKSCGHNKLIDLTGKKFGEWEVLEYVGDMYWKCRCSCGTIKNINGRHLREGTSTSCGHAGSSKRIDLTGQKFGEYTVLEYAGDKYWKCQCSCGKIKIIHGNRLRKGETTSCGHTNRLIDLVGRRFGKLTVEKYVGCRQYRCLCDCGNYKDIMAPNLTNDSTLSCGCLRETIYTKEMILENINKFVSEFNSKPFKSELAEYIGVSYGYMLYLAREYELSQDLFNVTFSSKFEKEVYSYIKSLIPDEEIILHDRKILNGYELDIYIPNKNIAIEVNGFYWHSDKMVGKYYHQQKTISCGQKGIRLIHIFEYEWIDPDAREKIQRLLRNVLCEHTNKIYARKCKLVKIDRDTEIKFLDINHLQGYTHSEIAFGLEYNNTIVSVMTFGKPRFNSNYQYELIRYAVVDDTTVIGGANKLFNALIKEFNPLSVVSYCDISKFSGNIYPKIGFKTNKDGLTTPNYVWIKSNFKSSEDLVTRYQSTLSKLKEKELGIYGDTEDEIMETLGYTKMYNSGNIRFIWEAETA